MNSTEETKRISVLQKHEAWYWILSFHISLLAIVGNAIVIFVILATPKLRTKQNSFILSLAVADLSVGLFITPSDFICSLLAACELQLQVVFYNFLLIASMTSLVAMTLDRYIAVIYPMRYTYIITKTNTILLITIAWMFAFFSSFIRLAWLYDENDVLKRHDRVYRLITNLAVGLFPCLILLFAFGRVFIAVRGQLTRQESQLMQVAFNHNHSTLTLTNPSQQINSINLEQEGKNFNVNSTRRTNENNRTKWRNKNRLYSSVRVLGSVVFLFIFCYSLNTVISFCEDFDLFTITHVFRDIAMILVFLNSSVNFIVYAFLKREFRQVLNLRIRSFRN